VGQRPGKAHSIVLVAAGAVAAIAACGLPKEAPRTPACVQRVCATLAGSEGVGRIKVEVTAPSGATLHQALLAPAGVPPCRAGTAVADLRVGKLFYAHGPAPIGGTNQVTLAFPDPPLFPESLDLDVRGAGGVLCVRVPIWLADAGSPHGG
jgi:hypothetical protein